MDQERPRDLVSVEFRRVLRAASLLCASPLILSCAAEDAEESVEVLGEAAGEMQGMVSHASTCSPFRIAYAERSHEWGRIVAASPAFKACVEDRMIEEYAAPCPGDPHSSLSASARRAAAWAALQDYGNHVTWNCLDEEGSASAGGAYGNYTEETINNLNQYDPEFGDWSNPASGSYYDQPFEPWQHRAAEVIHEFMHTAGYDHQTTCRGVPGVYDDCARELVEQSYVVCGDPRSCPVGQKRLASSFNAMLNTYGGPCACQRDPRHVVDFRLVSGKMLTAAWEGGEPGLRANWTDWTGAWQRFYLIDRTPADPLLSGWNAVHMRPMGDWFIGHNFAANFPAPATNFLHLGAYGAPWAVAQAKLWGSGAGYLNPYSLGTWMSASTYDSGGNFEMREPRRDHLVYLKSFHGKFVNVPTGQHWLSNNLTSVDPPTSLADRQSAAFWIVDHDGGSLQYNDEISLEGVVANAQTFWSNWDGGTGHLNMSSVYRDEGKFVVVSPTSATGDVRHGHTIALYSPATDTYVTALPQGAPFWGQLENYGTYVGTWQRFQIRFVENHDRDRSAVW